MTAANLLRWLLSVVVVCIQIKVHVILYRLRGGGGGMDHPVPLSGTFVFLLPLMISVGACYLLPRRALGDLVAIAIGVALGIGGLCAGLMTSITMYGT